MNDGTIKLFSSLERLLTKSKISLDQLPTNIEQWKDFIKRVNNSFYDFEQERYLLERSMEISSREMVELNDRLESAQSIAHIGYWFYNPIENRILWSKETYRIFGVDSMLAVPDLKGVLQMINEEDRSHLAQLIDRAINQGKGYETEFRAYNQADNKEYWLYAKAHPTENTKIEPKNGKKIYNLSGIVMDITERKITEKQMIKLNEKLITLSRQAGMSEIATSVLHNVGNILNSVNVSVGTIQELLNKSAVKDLSRVVKLMTENLPNNADYLLTDKKGKLIPEYLTCLSESLQNEYNQIDDEIKSLNNNIQHIKDIVIMQKDISGVSGIKEKIFLSEIVDLAIHMCCGTPQLHGIQIIRNYQFLKYVLLDKAKLLQILVNLIKNAKDSLATLKKNQPKIMNISIEKSPTKPIIEIIIKDNGKGIPKENLTKIFTMGFTTKKSGHGFGLHSSAIAAKELGGSLMAKSDGEGKGATFILTLPQHKKGSKT